VTEVIVNENRRGKQGLKTVKLPMKHGKIEKRGKQIHEMEK